MLVPLDLRPSSAGRVRVVLVSVSASSISDDEVIEGAVEELVVVVVMVGMVAGLASGKTGVESRAEVVMAVAPDVNVFALGWKFGGVAAGKFRFFPSGISEAPVRFESELSREYLSVRVQNIRVSLTARVSLFLFFFGLSPLFSRTLSLQWEREWLLGGIGVPVATPESLLLYFVTPPSHAQS